MLTKLSSENIKGRGHLEELSVYGRIILKLIFEKYNMTMWKRFN